MTHGGSPSDSEAVRGPDAGRAERERLDIALHAAALDTGDLDAAGSLLLDRLSRRSDDFEATGALQALYTFTAGQRADSGSDASARLRSSGLSSLERMRHRRVRRG